MVAVCVSYHVVLDVVLLLDFEVQVLRVLDVEPTVLLDVIDVCLLSLLPDVDELLLPIAATVGRIEGATGRGAVVSPVDSHSKKE